MSFATVYSRARVGIDAPLVTIEVHISNGLPSFQIVGLPDASVRESRDRVRSALINSDFQFPQTRLTVNLSPADIPKEGARFDLAIAVGILAASAQVPVDKLTQYEFYGELGLNGDVRAIIGEIPTSIACGNANRICILPKANIIQAGLVETTEMLEATTLMSVFHHLTGQQSLTFTTPIHNVITEEVSSQNDLSDVIGQVMAKRALEIAAAGQHNLLFLGPPGTGKSMLASRLASILPAMSIEEALQTAAIHSISGKPFDFTQWRTRPFRNPHHTASGVALVGGGSVPKPGEISLSHNGVLFLDELPEFDRKVLDVLREPMETGEITISRATQQADFPARFQFVGALNPSPTGHHNDGRCTSDQVLKYLNKISGPLLDRIDIQIDVPALPKGALTQDTTANRETSAVVKQRVNQARDIMLSRAGKPNALLTSKEVTQYCVLLKEDQIFLEHTIHQLKMSIRAYHKILKVARTIADLQLCPEITRGHLTEALNYRAMDRLLAHLSQ
jgi:magnesium chelatase family protein